LATFQNQFYTTGMYDQSFLNSAEVESDSRLNFCALLFCLLLYYTESFSCRGRFPFYCSQEVCLSGLFCMEVKDTLSLLSCHWYIWSNTTCSLPLATFHGKFPLLLCCSCVYLLSSSNHHQLLITPSGEDDPAPHY